MTVTVERKERNQSIELCRLAAAIAVIFLHVPLPERVNGYVNCLARFAVPFFFMVSGYYSFGRDSAWLKRQLWRVLKLNVYATIPYCIWRCWVYYDGTRIGEFIRWEFFRKGVLSDWIILHVNPMAGHLWFLAALVSCYLALWLYGKLREGENDAPLYLLGAFLMMGCFLFSALLPANEVLVPYKVYRNGWFLGLPLFLLGMFLHEYEETILEKFHLTTGKLLLLTAAGVLLSLLQYRDYGSSEIFLGTILEMIALMLLLTAHPVLPGKLLKGITPHLGRISTVIYVIHLLFLEAYQIYIRPQSENLLGHWEPWLRPFLIAAVSLVTAIAWDGLLSYIMSAE